MAYSAVISSQEKNTGNIFIYISYLFLFLSLVVIYVRFSETGSKFDIYSLPFLFFFLLLYLSGKDLNNKFNKLGSTPLILNSSIILKGITQGASITINKSNFNYVKDIQLKCLKRLPSGNGGYRSPTVVFEKSISLEPKFNGDSTTLYFDFEIPYEESKSGERNHLGYTFWSLSFHFLDGNEVVARSWVITVK
ncbi:MAG: hypothetical protein HRU38_25105 [Saccharospirillaceae bacterium]|nr:hypothetical protein [Saccharospirillaceae bacterium]